MISVLVFLVVMVCIALRQQILAVSMHHVPSTMVLLPIPKVVLAARVNALLPMVCFACLQQILAVSIR